MEVGDLAFDNYRTRADRRTGRFEFVIGGYPGRGENPFSAGLDNLARYFNRRFDDSGAVLLDQVADLLEADAVFRGEMGCDGTCRSVDVRALDAAEPFQAVGHRVDATRAPNAFKREFDTSELREAGKREQDEKRDAFHTGTRNLRW